MAKLHRNTTHERVADSILTAINSRPRTPTKSELMAVLAGWQLINSAVNDNEPNPEPHVPSRCWQMQPSRLGHRVIQTMRRAIETAIARANTVDVEGMP